MGSAEEHKSHKYKTQIRQWNHFSEAHLTLFYIRESFIKGYGIFNLWLGALTAFLGRGCYLDHEHFFFLLLKMFKANQ